MLKWHVESSLFAVKRMVCRLIMSAAERLSEKRNIWSRSEASRTNVKCKQVHLIGLQELYFHCDWTKTFFHVK